MKTKIKKLYLVKVKGIYIYVIAFNAVVAYQIVKNWFLCKHNEQDLFINEELELESIELLAEHKEKKDDNNKTLLLLEDKTSSEEKKYSKKYKAIVKSAKEITGIDCKEFFVMINNYPYHYVKDMNKLAGQQIIVEKEKDDNIWDYKGKKYEWLSWWLKDIEFVGTSHSYDIYNVKKYDTLTWKEYVRQTEKKL